MNEKITPITDDLDFMHGKNGRSPRGEDRFLLFCSIFAIHLCKFDMNNNYIEMNV